MLSQRLTKSQRHLRKWARKNAITCYRVYKKDIPTSLSSSIGMMGEWFYTHHAGKKDETEDAHHAWMEEVKKAVCEGLSLTEDSPLHQRQGTPTRRGAVRKTGGCTE